MSGATVQGDTAAPARGYALEQPLPAEVQVGGRSAWNRYQQFPAFSWPWLCGRMRVFAVAIAGFALLSFLGLAVQGNLAAGLLAGGYLFAGFMLMSTCGPAMATWVRHRRWPEARERLGVVVAWALGVLLAYIIDSWASANIDRIVQSLIADPAVMVEARQAMERHSGSLQRVLLLVLNILALVGIYGLLGGGLALRAYFGERRRWEAHRHARQLGALRAQKQEVDLRLGVLQAQVEPHFLFNTLASVRALIRRDPERSEATLDAMVRHLRDTIPQLREGEALLRSTLGAQLDVCASYLEVMRLRTSDRLSWTVDADAALRALPYPPLLLITLVENAVKHGIEPRPGPGRIELRAARHDGSLVVTVSDDGVGLVPGAGGGMGLANVRAQLDARFGTRASLRLRAREGGGIVAELVTPLEEREA